MLLFWSQRRFSVAMLMLTPLSTVSSFTFKPCESSSRARSTARLSLFSSSSLQRRHFLGSILAGTSLFLPQQSPANARGLVQFPCAELGNTYHFIRAGESLMEQDDIWSTNPLFLTNRDSALSPEGIRQVEETCRYLNEQNISPTIVMYSLAASSMDTANIIGRELRIGRDRLVPEFTYLDPRAIGRFDSLPLASTQAAVWAMDNDEAGADGRGARPPPNEDGTPNETLDNQSTRLRQLLSLMETQYSGDTVILVFPDGTGPALLSCMIAGIPFNRVHELNYCPGEIRLDVNMKSTKSLLNSGEILPADYKEILAQGRQELKRLRTIRSEDIVSVRDQKLEDERLEIEARAMEREKKRAAKDKQDQLAREARAQAIQQERQKRIETDTGNDDNALMMAVVGAVGASAAAAALFSGKGNDDSEKPAESTNATASPTLDSGPSIEMNEGTSVVDILDDEEHFRPALVVPRNNETELLVPIVGGEEEEEDAGTSRLRVNGDRQATFPPPTKSRDPVKAAEDAMKEYMELDDGGSDWLLMMSDLMMEKDEDVDESSQGLRP